MPQISAPLSAHDWFHPRLAALLAQADKAGFPRDVAQAVITDLVNGVFAAGNAIPRGEENWARDIGEPPEAAHEMPQKTGLPPESLGDRLGTSQIPDLPGQVTI